MHQSGFTAAGRTDYRNEFAAFNVERYVVQSANLFVAETVDFADVSEFDESHGGVMREGKLMGAAARICARSVD
jgi:hypothetical protein